MIARYEFIDEEKACTTEMGQPKYTIVKMCEWMEVSTSGFYEWLNRPLSATATRRAYLKLLIEKAFADSDEVVPALVELEVAVPRLMPALR